VGHAKGTTGFPPSPKNQHATDPYHGGVKKPNPEGKIKKIFVISGAISIV